MFTATSIYRLEGTFDTEQGALMGEKGGAAAGAGLRDRKVRLGHLPDAVLELDSL